MNKFLRVGYKRKGNTLVFTVTFDDIAQEDYCLDIAARVIYGSWHRG